jgi:hypothetical protein
MTSQIQLRFKLLTGRIESIQISRAATVLDAKRQLHAKLSDAPPHRQKLILTGLGTILEDGRTLSSYPQINSQNSGTTIGIIIQLPWKIYVQDPTSKIYEVEIPSSEPQVLYMQITCTVHNYSTVCENKMNRGKNSMQHKKYNHYNNYNYNHICVM